MSRLHAAVVSVYILVMFGIPAVLAIAIFPGYLGLWLCSALMTWVVAGASADSGFHAFPVTHRLRAINRYRKAREDAIQCRRKRDQCRELAYSYRERGEPYQAEMLIAQADAYSRQAAMRDEDAERINREIEDRKMQELTK